MAVLPGCHVLLPWATHGDAGPDAPTCIAGCWRAITIDHTKVGVDGSTGGPLSKFPVVVQHTEPWLKTTSEDPANGRVADSDGGDIYFTDAARSTRLPHEIEAYDGAGGSLTAWVRLNTVSLSSETTFHIHYGRTGPDPAPPPPSPEPVWDEHYGGVWHMNPEPAGTGAPSVLPDSTEHGNDCHPKPSQQGGPTATSGHLAGGLEFDGSDDYLDCGNDSSLDIGSKMTFSVWVRIPEPPQNSSQRYTVFSKGDVSLEFLFPDSGTPPYEKDLRASFTLITRFLSWSYPMSIPLDAGPIDLGAWHHLAMTLDNRTLGLFLNGKQMGTKGSPPLGSISGALEMGRPNNGTDHLYFKGRMDEVRGAATVRSADWIRTSYENQNSPETFYTVGAEQSQ